MERWLPVVGYEGRYEVSDLGQVRRVGGRLLKPGRVRGHRHVSLCGDGKPRSVRLHLLVLEAFVGPRSAGLEARHLDDDGDNNRLDNLCWGTRRENMLDRVRNGRHHHANKTHCMRGHKFTAESTSITSQGSRQCLECKRLLRRRRVAA